MTICRECGAHRTERVSRGPLMMQRDPAQAYWRGKPFHLPPLQFEILYLLCARAEVSHLAIEIIGSRPETTSAACKVHLTGLRKRLPPEVTIEAIRGWGYRLNVKE